MSGNLFQKKKDLHWVDYLEIFWRLKWYLIVPVLLSAAAAVVLVIRMPQIYRSSATVLVEPQQVSEDYVKSSINGIMEDRLAAIRQQILSRSLLQQIIDQFGLYHKESKYLSNEEILDLMRKKIDIKNEMSRKTFTISFENENPKIAMDVTNQLASLFVEENLKVQELVEGTTEFLRKQLDSLKDSLNKQEQVIAEFKQKYRESLPPQLDVNIRALDRYQTELQNLSASISSTEEKRRTYEERARMARVPASVAPDEGADSKAAPDEKSSDDYASLLQMKRSLEDLRLEYTDAYPDIVLLKRKIKDLEDSIYKKQLAAAELDKERSKDRGKSKDTPAAPAISFNPENPKFASEIASLKERQAGIRDKIQQIEKAIDQSPIRQQELDSLYRDYENTKKAYQSLLDKKLSAELSESLEKRQKGAMVRILDPANFPEKGFKPNKVKMIMYCLGPGAGVGVLFVFLIDFLDMSFRKPEEIEEELGLNVLATIPEIDSQKSKPKRTIFDKIEERIGG